MAHVILGKWTGISTRFALFLCMALLQITPYASSGQQTQAQKDDPASEATTLPASEPLSPDRVFALASPAVADVFADVSPAVVQITALGPSWVKIASGSGFIVQCQNDKQCTVITNYHVVESACKIDVTLVDGTVTTATEVLAENADADVIFLKIVVPQGISATRIITLENHDPLRIGTRVITIGNPIGLTNSLSDGLVAGYRERENGGKWVQITAPISPGSSGGPVLTHEGSLVGMATASFTGGQNLNLAIPTSDLLEVLRTRKGGRPVCQGVSINFVIEQVLRPAFDPILTRFQSEFPNVLSRGLAWSNIRIGSTNVGQKRFVEFLEALADKGDPVAQLLVGWAGTGTIYHTTPPDADIIHRTLNRLRSAAADAATRQHKALAYYLAGRVYLNIRSFHGQQMSVSVIQNGQAGVWAYSNVFTGYKATTQERAADPVAARRYAEVLVQMQAMHRNYIKAGAEAEERLLLALKTDPGFTPAIQSLVFVHSDLGVPDPAALGWADRLVEQVPRCSTAYSLRGRVRQELGDASGGVADLARAVRLDPGNFFGVTDLAKVHRSLGRHVEALEVLRTATARRAAEEAERRRERPDLLPFYEALDAKGDLPMVLLQVELGTTYCELGRCAEAGRAFDAASKAGSEEDQTLITQARSRCRLRCPG